MISSLVFCLLAFAAPNLPLVEGVEPPQFLSQTGLFEGDVKNLKPSKDLRAYELNQPLWTDFATKTRYFYLPLGGKIQFSKDSFWKFPIGTVAVKLFRMEIEAGVFKNLETRVLVHLQQPDKWIGYTYVWEGDDARLLPDGQNTVLSFSVSETAKGGKRTQVFTVPNRAQCLQCHDQSVGSAIGIRTEQLNRDVGGRNQLETFDKLGLFSEHIGSPAQYAAFAAITDANAPLDLRVRSYLASNCAHCHNQEPTASCRKAPMDLRFDRLKTMDLVGAGMVVPGFKDLSPLYQRITSQKDGVRMPLLGVAIPDQSAVDAIGKWIDTQ